MGTEQPKCPTPPRAGGSELIIRGGRRAPRLIALGLLILLLPAWLTAAPPSTLSSSIDSPTTSTASQRSGAADFAETTPSAKGSEGAVSGNETLPIASDTSSTAGSSAAAPRRNVIRVAHDLHYPPYEFIDATGESQGFGIDIIREAAKRIGLDAEFIAVSWEGVLDALKTGRADITPEMMNSPERKRTWYLGEPWGDTWSVVFVLRESSYQRLKDLWGRKIAVPAGDIELEHLARLRAFTLEVVPNTQEALDLLDRGEVQAIACNRDVALHVIGQSRIALGRLRALDDPLAVTPYSIAGRTEKQYLIQSLTETIQDMKKDGTYEALHWKWFLRPSDESIRAIEQRDLLRRAVFIALISLAVIMAGGFLYYRRRKAQLEKLVRRRTKELTLSERHYRALFDHARDAIFLLDPEDRTITDINPSAETLTGRSRRRLIGKPIDELFPPEERAKADDLFDKQMREEEKTISADLVLQRPDGARAIAQVRGALVKLKEGTTLYAVFRDITETAQARRLIEERNNELRIQNAVALALQHDLPMGRRMGGGLDAILGLEDFHIRQRAAIFLLEPGKDELILASARGIRGATSMEDIEKSAGAPAVGSAAAVPDPPNSSPSPAAAPLTRAPVGKGEFRRALQGEFVVVGSCRGELFHDFLSSDEPEHGHVLCPLRSEGRILGVLCLFTDAHASFDEARRALLEGLSSQIGIVIESERREQALREREHRLESLYEIAVSLGSSIHLTEQLRILFTQIRRVMPADAGNVWVSDSDEFTGLAEVYYSFDTEEDGSLVESTSRQEGRASPGTSIYRVFTTSEPVLIQRSEDQMQALAPPTRTQFGLQRRSRSLLYVPLKFKGRVIGVLTVQSYTAFAYTQETVDVLMSLSAQLAAVIENARLFEAVELRRAELDKSLKMIEADLKAAQVAQESLLPKEFPTVGGWGFASIFIPSQYVGGDIYNVFKLDECHIGLYHIDVSGHGVPAALFSVGLNQYLMRDLLGPGVMCDSGEKPGHLRIRSPEDVIAALDRENMFQKHQRFFTMLYLVADVRTGVIRFYRAGHNEPLLLRKGEPPRYLAGGGPLIGFQLPRAASELQEIQLQPGDRLVIYSDGINEAIDPEGELYGLDRLAEFLARSDGANLQTTFNNLVEDVRKFSSSQTFEDDVSMIGIAWNPAPRPDNPGE